MSEIRYVFKNNVLRKANQGELAKILSDESLSGDERDQLYLNASGPDELEKVRERRNFLLQECDWTQLADSSLTDNKKNEWATYRTALRNLPANLVDSEGKPTMSVFNPSWPTKPS
jgi:hypothetical protein